MPKYVLCQNCLRVRPYSDALHQNEGSCSCGGDMCGCPDCNEIADKLLSREFQAFEKWDFRHAIDFTGYTVEGGLVLNKVVKHA